MNQRNRGSPISRVISAVVAVASGAATIYGLFNSPRIAVLAFLGMVLAVLLMLVVQRAADAVSDKDQHFYDWLAKILLVFAVAYFILLLAFLFPVVYRWLSTSVLPPAGTQSTDNLQPPPQPNKKPIVYHATIACNAAVLKLHLANGSVVESSRAEPTDPSTESRPEMSFHGEDVFVRTGTSNFIVYLDFTCDDADLKGEMLVVDSSPSDTRAIINSNHQQKTFDHFDPVTWKRFEINLR